MRGGTVGGVCKKSLKINLRLRQKQRLIELIFLRAVSSEVKFLKIVVKIMMIVNEVFKVSTPYI